MSTRTQVQEWLEAFHGRLVGQLEVLAGQEFGRDAWTREGEAGLGGRGLTCVMEDSEVFERGGVAFSDVRGTALPPSATQRKPQLVGKAWRATGVSLVLHPRNPHAPTAHLNVRSFVTEDGSAWWFGGGYDLTPTYLYDEDVAHWHGVAKRVLEPLVGPAGVERLRADCDVYFTNQHRRERRGVGGVFFDDLDEGHGLGGSYDHCVSVMQKTGESFFEAYAPLIERRRGQPWTEAQKRWQEWRRSRYVEFNLVWDRGTLFGLQSRGRAESILMSMPPVARWTYGEPKNLGAEERRLLDALKVS